jgi:hypothetical protein
MAATQSSAVSKQAQTTKEKYVSLCRGVTCEDDRQDCHHQFPLRVAKAQSVRDLDQLCLWREAVWWSGVKGVARGGHVAVARASVAATMPKDHKRASVSRVQVQWCVDGCLRFVEEDPCLERTALVLDLIENEVGTCERVLSYAGWQADGFAKVIHASHLQVSTSLR